MGMILKRQRNKFYILLFILITAAVVVGYIYVRQGNQKTETPIDEPLDEPKKIELQPVNEPKVLKPSVFLTVPYTVQAPFANWNIHEESCEEAALLMAHYYLTSEKFVEDRIPNTRANSEIIDLVNWQKSNYNGEFDLDMPTLGKLFKDYYGHNFEVKKNVTDKEIKESLSVGELVIVPVMTHSLDNPHYGPQTTYHVLVLVGYENGFVIANDPGIKEGKGYKYTWETLWKAVDAQTSKMKQGRDALIIKK